MKESASIGAFIWPAVKRLARYWWCWGVGLLSGLAGALTDYTGSEIDGFVRTCLWTLFVLGCGIAPILVIARMLKELDNLTTSAVLVTRLNDLIREGEAIHKMIGFSGLTMNEEAYKRNIRMVDEWADKCDRTIESTYLATAWKDRDRSATGVFEILSSGSQTRFPDQNELRARSAKTLTQLKELRDVAVIQKPARPESES